VEIFSARNLHHYAITATICNATAPNAALPDISICGNTSAGVIAFEKSFQAMAGVILITAAGNAAGDGTNTH
jgi:hypothetical protein